MIVRIRIERKRITPGLRNELCPRYALVHAQRIDDVAETHGGANDNEIGQGEAVRHAFAAPPPDSAGGNGGESSRRPDRLGHNVTQSLGRVLLPAVGRGGEATPGAIRRTRAPISTSRSCCTLTDASRDTVNRKPSSVSPTAFAMSRTRRGRSSASMRAATSTCAHATRTLGAGRFSSRALLPSVRTLTPVAAAAVCTDRCAPPDEAVAT